MLVEYLGAPIYIRKAPQHDQLKEVLLNAIDSMGRCSIEDCRQKISNTDWLLPSNRLRAYISIAKPMFDEHFQALIAREYSIVPDTVVTQAQYWFQQYGVGDYHGWHHHGNAMFSNVYYLELPDGSAATSFFTDGKEVSIPVEEGCILSFPTSLLHRSKPNESKRKSVIVVNTSFDRDVRQG